MSERHPVQQILRGRRLRAMSEAFKQLAEEIDSAAHDLAFLEQTEGLWNDKFFRAVCGDVMGLVITSRFKFHRASELDVMGHRSEPLDPELKMGTVVGAGTFTGCGPIPLEIKLILDIPDERGSDDNPS